MRARQTHLLVFTAFVLISCAVVWVATTALPESFKMRSDMVGPFVIIPVEHDHTVRRKAVRSALTEAIRTFRQDPCDTDFRRTTVHALEAYMDTRDAEAATLLRPWGKSDREMDIAWRTPLDVELMNDVSSFVRDGFLAMDDFSRFRAIFGLRKRTGSWWKNHTCNK